MNLETVFVHCLLISGEKPLGRFFSFCFKPVRGVKKIVGSFSRLNNFMFLCRIPTSNLIGLRSCCLTSEKKKMPGQIKDNILETNLKKLENRFLLNNFQLEKIVSICEKEMVKGLQQPSSSGKSSLSMLPTYVCSLPTGQEEGCYLALDLGGTNFRVLLVKIFGAQNETKRNVEMVSELFMISEEVKQGTGEAFFDHIATCMSNFCANNNLKNTPISVGFTFSFPLVQQKLDSAVLMTWNKGFNVSDVVGNDVVKMLHDALERRGDLNCKVVAVVNDTVGTMMACALDQHICKIGLIVGTGLNACYMEKIENIEKVKIETSQDEMCINMEMGGLGSNGTLNSFRSKYDYTLDESTSNPQEQIFEKMVSGKYLGEVVRLILCDLVEKFNLFGGVGSKKLLQKYSFLTAFVSEIVGSKITSNSFNTVRNILNSFVLQPSEQDCDVVIRVCQLVSTRAAYLTAAAVAAVALKIKNNHPDNSNVTVGVDGTMYRKLPNFSKNLTAKVEELCQDHQVKVDFVLSQDGSGKGAAVIAAAVCDTS